MVFFLFFFFEWSPAKSESYFSRGFYKQLGYNGDEIMAKMSLGAT